MVRAVTQVVMRESVGVRAPRVFSIMRGFLKAMRLYWEGDDGEFL